jgi:predicted metalloenzyme YecM/heme-degrading monooxygenase HmoA
MTKGEFYSQAHVFLIHLFQQLKNNRILLKPEWEIDHLCYRTKTIEDYHELKGDFIKLGELIIEGEVNGRPIATYKLNEPVLFKKYKIEIVELPAPKVGKLTTEGFEHVEVVCDISFEQLRKDLQHCKTDESGLTKRVNKEFEVILDSCAIKFHHQTLLSVIEEEKANLKTHLIGPYYKVTFISILKEIHDGYELMAQSMEKLASQQMGFLGIESTRDENLKGVTISYWKNLESIKKWKEHPEHIKAQQMGKELWYKSFSVEITKIE